jgi:hypothetical protein
MRYTGTVHVAFATVMDIGGSLAIAPGKGPCVCGLNEENSSTGSYDAELHNVRLVWCCSSVSY